VLTALPLAVFQLTGHILSSTATSLIPVSLVHTIKGLSPLFTVLAYRLFFRIRYARATYLSLIPLTLGVVLACSAGFSSNFFGIFCALLGALVFVTQNIFSKRLFNEAARAEADGQGNTHQTRKLDKLNLLCYCSGGAFLLTAPIWLLTEGFPLLMDVLHDGVIALSNKKGALDHGPLLLEFFLNGIFHFGQNIMAFILLSMVSPVSYSVASLIKRVFVIAVAIIWFGNPTTNIQAFGIGLTFLGLYLYDRTSHEDAADRRANADHFRSRETILPLISERPEPNGWQHSNGHARSSSGSTIRAMGEKLSSGYMKGVYADNRKEDTPTPGRPRSNSQTGTWLPPGTKQESTWELRDMTMKS
jgi:solute carrier family 35 protein E1